MIGLLSKLPWVINILGFFQSKTRLVIEYALIGAIVVIGGFTFSMWLSKEQTEKSLLVAENELLTVQSRLNIVEFSNQQQETTIEELKALRFKDAQVLTGLLVDFKVLAENDDIARQRLATLEKSDETVRAYLNQRIPPNLACLLNDTCEAGTKVSNETRKDDSTGTSNNTMRKRNSEAANTDKGSR